MSQNLKIVLISGLVLILTGIFLFFSLRKNKIISPLPEKFDVSVLFSPVKEKITPAALSPTPKPSPTEKQKELILELSPTPSEESIPTEIPEITETSTEIPTETLTPTEVPTETP